MNRWKLLTCACLLLALLAVMAAKTVRTLASSPTNCGGWSDVKSPNPNPLFNLLYGVAAISSNDVWTVGYTHDNNDIRKALVEHWDGSSWNVVPSPNPSTNHNELYAVAATSSNDVWAVGYSDKNHGNASTLTEHWNGSTWKVVPSPSPGYDGDALQGVAAISANNVWAVGYHSTGIFQGQTLIEHWNGSTWSVVPSPNPDQGGNNTLQGVTAISTNDVWAIGLYIDINSLVEHTIAEHWDGSSWKLVASANPNPTLDTFNAISAFSTNDVWAVGTAGMGGLGGLIEHWNGSKWSGINDPNIGTTWLNGVAAISPNNVWIIGLESLHTHIEQWNGKSWKITPSPNPSSHGDVLRGIANVPGSTSLWTVGNYYPTQGVQNSNTLTIFHC
jgi:hypothetical protein